MTRSKPAKEETMRTLLILMILATPAWGQHWVSQEPQNEIARELRLQRQQDMFQELRRENEENIRRSEQPLFRFRDYDERDRNDTFDDDE
jgi:hypothetical protein